MTVTVVLGMHGSGTSAVAGCLREMGVDMGTTFVSPMQGRPLWEDVYFVKLNSRLLAAAGGNWANPPEVAMLERAAESLRAEMELLITRRQADNPNTVWGWKDPRNSVTAFVWHPLLTEPRYVVVTRDYADIAHSILARGPSAKKKEEWIGGAIVHYERIERFLLDTNALSVKVAYEDLTHRAKADQVLETLVRFLDLPGGSQAVDTGLAVITFRETRR